MFTTNTNDWVGAAPADRPTKARILAAVSTGVFSALMTVSGVLYLVRPPFIVAPLQLLGYPVYFLKLLGVAKLLGVVGLLQTRRPTLREWAYAGFTFDLLAAVYSHFATGTVQQIPAAVVALSMLVTSYLSRRRAKGAVR